VVLDYATWWCTSSTSRCARSTTWNGCGQGCAAPRDRPAEPIQQPVPRLRLWCVAARRVKPGEERRNAPAHEASLHHCHCLVGVCGVAYLSWLHTRTAVALHFTPDAQHHSAAGRSHRASPLPPGPSSDIPILAPSAAFVASGSDPRRHGVSSVDIMDRSTRKGPPMTRPASDRHLEYSARVGTCCADGELQQSAACCKRMGAASPRSRRLLAPRRVAV